VPGGQAARRAHRLTAVDLGSRRRPTSVTIGLLVAGCGFLLDQATKELAVRVLRGRIIEFGPFRLHLVFNEGGAFGLDLPWWAFLVVTVVVAVLIVRTLPKATNQLEPFAYGLLLAGALGNVTDRLLRPPGRGHGEVVDFLGSTFWPTFNLADVGITFGFVLLVGAVIVSERQRR
jgi:signal peptidase II